MSDSPTDILTRARNLLSDPSRWTQKGWFAYDNNGLSRNPRDSTAVCFCAIGALENVTTSDTPQISTARYQLALATPGRFDSVPDYNDDPNTTHADILALFDRAILKGTNA